MTLTHSTLFSCHAPFTHTHLPSLSAPPQPLWPLSVPPAVLLPRAFAPAGRTAWNVLPSPPHQVNPEEPSHLSSCATSSRKPSLTYLSKTSYNKLSLATYPLLPMSQLQLGI